jgi:hypothetical protein
MSNTHSESKTHPLCPTCTVPYRITWRDLDQVIATVRAECGICGAAGEHPVVSTLVEKAPESGSTDEPALTFMAAVLGACHKADRSKQE